MEYALYSCYRMLFAFWEGILSQSRCWMSRAQHCLLCCRFMERREEEEEIFDVHMSEVLLAASVLRTLLHTAESQTPPYTI